MSEILTNILGNSEGSTYKSFILDFEVVVRKKHRFDQVEDSRISTHHVSDVTRDKVPKSAKNQTKRPVQQKINHKSIHPKEKRVKIKMS